MTGQRFIAVASRKGALTPAWRERATSMIARRSLARCHDDPRLLVAGSGIAARPLAHAGGTVIGDLFQQNRPIPSCAMADVDDARIQASNGHALIDNFWGSYIAFLSGPDDSPRTVLRAPLGDLPCLYAVTPDAVMLASDVGLLAELRQFEPKPDPARLLRFLLAEDLHRAETCLEGVEELTGGHQLTLADGQIAVTARWTPWRFIDPAMAITEPGRASDALRSAILDSIGVHSAAYDRVVLRLSGGLDSSIIAAALAAHRRDTVPLNLVTADPSGDERDYARSVAEHLGLALTEVTRAPGHVDLTRSDAAALPRPTARAFAQASHRHSSELAQQIGATAVFDGGGGDSIFCFLVSARLAADCLMTPAGIGHFWHTASNIAALARVSRLAVARRAWAIRLRRSAAFRYPTDERFLPRDLARGETAAATHPWLTPSTGALPGRAAHLAAIAAVQGVREGRDPTLSLPLVSPLLSQPVIETCLRIPSWLWVRHGRDRAIARAAFADLLPAKVIQRRSKGSPDAFLIELYDANRAVIRTMLLDGALAAAGLLDRAAIAACLDDPRPVMGVDFYRILRLVDVDAWLRARC